MKANIILSLTVVALLVGCTLSCSQSRPRPAPQPTPKGDTTEASPAPEEPNSSTTQPGEQPPAASEVVDELHTPEMGSPERRAMMDGLRLAMDSRGSGYYQPHRGSITFVVNYLKSHNGWAWVFADPHSSDSSDSFGESSGYLLHLQDGQWQAMELPGMVNDPDDPENLDYPSRKDVERIRRQYPTAPADIFPKAN